MLVVLSASQGFYLSAMSIDLTVTALAGASLAPSPVWSTLPMAAIAIGSVLVAPMVSWLMAKLGTKPTLIAGAVTAVLGGVLSWLAMTKGIFVLLCLGTFAVGVYQSIANYYRYIAADSRPGQEAKSVAVVLSAGVVAAIIGPIIATVTGDLLVPLYSGAYLAVAVLGLGAIATLSLLPRHCASANLVAEQDARPGQAASVSVLDLFRRPLFSTGALLSFAGCFSMAIVMAGAPLEMEHSLHTSETMRMFGMQLHMVGMYAPMLILPLIAGRLSHCAQAIIGIVLGLIGLLVGLVGSGPAITVTLFLVGVAWAISYAIGSALLTTSYTAAERRIARGIGELFPVSGLAVGSLLAGPLTTQVGWGFLTSACIAVLVSAGAMVVFYRRSLLN
ncbi:MFS transporter [Corynebacterium falsenii]